jgi:transcriptional regulator
VTTTITCPTCGFTGTYASDALADYNLTRHSCARHQRKAETAQRRAQHTKGGPKRDCRHPRARHVHGTRAAYVKDQCRCHHCRAANASASNTRHRERTYGRWAPFVDATPVREHIQMLRQSGIGIDQIANLAETSSSHIRSLIYHSRTGKPPIQKVRPETARDFLKIQATDANRAPRSHIDATGTQRRIQALNVMGWTQASLAAELGRSPANLRRSMTSDSVTARTAQLVNVMYERLWDAQPPHQTTAQRTASATARAHATQQGWLPPLAWDDIDSDPDPDPNKPDPDGVHSDPDEIAIERAIAGDTQLRLTHAEQIRVVHRMSERGRSIRTIAELLSTSKRTVSRHRQTSAA